MQDIESKTGVTGEAVLSGRLLLGVGSASNLLTLGFGFVSVMALLAAIGITYSGWGTTGSPRPELWAVAALLGLAMSYAIIISVDIQRESKATLTALETSWLASLYRAEQFLCALGQSGRYSHATQQELLRGARVLLQMAERADPTFPWLQSLRGRAELYEAVAAAGPYRRALEPGSISTDADARWYADSLERHLLLAEPLLQQGARRKDDPVAGVALAKALELTATLGRDGTGRHKARADILVGLAASQFGTQRLDRPNRVPVHGPSVAWAWLDQQEWLWPTDEQRAQALDSLRPRPRRD